MMRCFHCLPFPLPLPFAVFLMRQEVIRQQKCLSFHSGMPPCLFSRNTQSGKKKPLISPCLVSTSAWWTVWITSAVWSLTPRRSSVPCWCLHTSAKSKKRAKAVRKWAGTTLPGEATTQQQQEHRDPDSCVAAGQVQSCKEFLAVLEQEQDVWFMMKLLC